MPFQFENLPSEYDKLPVPVYILKGRSSAAKGGVIGAYCDQFPPQFYEVVDGYFKLYLHLGYGTNDVTLRHSDGGTDQNGYNQPGKTTYEETVVRLVVEPLNKIGPFEVPKIHFCVLLGRDSEGQFDCPQQTLYQGNKLETAVRKMRIAGRIMQMFTLDEMARNGVGRRCFQFVEEMAPSTVSRQDEQQGAQRQVIKVHVIRSKYSTAEIQSLDFAQQNSKAKNQGKLFDIALEALRDSGGDFSDAATNETPALAAVLLLDSKWDRQNNLIRGHAALGGGTDRIKLAIFGSHGLHSWPLDWESIFRGFTDCSRLSTDEVANDCNQCGTRWECLCVTLGAFLHEVGHSLGCPHEENGVMLRDYITMDRKFLAKERFRLLTNKTEWGPVLTRDEPGWNRLDIMRFLFHPAFSLAQDFRDPVFKPPLLMGGQGMKSPPQVDKGPNFMPVDSDTVQISSDTGIYLVFCQVGEWSRLHYEYNPGMYGGMGPQQRITLNYSVIQNQLDAKWRGQPVKLEVLTLGFGQSSIDNLHEYLQNGNRLYDLGGGLRAHRSSLYGNNSGRAVQAVIPPGKEVAKIRIRHGGALDGFEICFTDRTSALFGNGGSFKSEFVFQQGEKLVGFAVRSGAWVDGIAFITDRRVSPHYGPTGGSVHRFTVPQGSSFLGFYGEMGSWLNKLGGYYG